MSKQFEVEVTFTDRKQGPGTLAGRERVEANSLPVAIGKSFRSTWKTLDRKQRFDAAKGVTIKAWIIPGEKSK